MRVTRKEIYEIMDKLTTDSNLLDTLRTLVKEAEKYGDMKDLALNFIVGQIAHAYDDPDAFLANIEALKVGVIIKDLRLLEPLLRILSKPKEEQNTR